MFKDSERTPKMTMFCIRNKSAGLGVVCQSVVIEDISMFAKIFRLGASHSQKLATSGTSRSAPEAARSPSYRLVW